MSKIDRLINRTNIKNQNTQRVNVRVSGIDYENEGIEDETLINTDDDFVDDTGNHSTNYYESKEINIEDYLGEYVDHLITEEGGEIIPDDSQDEVPTSQELDKLVSIDQLKYKYPNKGLEVIVGQVKELTTRLKEFDADIKEVMLSWFEEELS